MWQLLLRGKLRPDVEIDKPGIPEENEPFKLKLPIFSPLCFAPVMPVFCNVTTHICVNVIINN